MPHSFPTRRSSDLYGGKKQFGRRPLVVVIAEGAEHHQRMLADGQQPGGLGRDGDARSRVEMHHAVHLGTRHVAGAVDREARLVEGAGRSEEHTSELQSLMRISYAVFCLKKK